MMEESMPNYEFISSHDPKTWQRILKAQIFDEASEEKGAYSLQNCYIGTVADDKIDIFYHKESASRLLETRFIGHVEPNGTGCKAVGSFTQAKTTLFFLNFTIAVMAVASVVMLNSGFRTQVTAPLLFLLIALVLRFHKPKHQMEMVVKLLTDTCTANPEDFPEKPPVPKPEKKKKKKGRKNKKAEVSDGTIRDAANWKSSDQDD